MPNIEIHGFAKVLVTDHRVELDDFQGLRANIISFFSKKPYANDIVVTMVADVATDCNFQRQPFLRVYSTIEPHLTEVIKFLKTLNVDIEVIIINAWHPKKIPAELSR